MPSAWLVAGSAKAITPPAIIALNNRIVISPGTLGPDSEQRNIPDNSLIYARNLCSTASTTAKHTESGAMRVVERDAPERLGEARPQVETRVVRQERAGDHARPRCSLKPDDHARTGAHQSVGRFADQIPARFADFRHICCRIHLGKDGQHDRVGSVDRHPERPEKAGKTVPNCALRFTRKPPARHRYGEAVGGQPAEP